MICCAGILFFIGLSMVVSGRVQINQRVVESQRVRTAGWVLISAPLAMFAVETFFTPDINVNADPFQAARALGPVVLVEMVIFLGALYLAWWLIAKGPSQPVKPMKPYFPTQPQPPLQQMEPVFGKVLTLAEAARYLRVSEDDVLELINSNQLAAARVGGEYRIARIAIDDYLAGHKDDD